MRKRIFSLLLILTMLVGMLPAGARASAQEQAGNGFLNAVYGSVTLDGSLNEAWQLTGSLGQTRFGAIYGAGDLYLGFRAALDVTVKLNGETVTGETQKGESATEVKISLADLGLYQYDQTAELELTAGESTWSGTVRFDSADMVSQTLKSESHSGSTSGTAVDGGWNVKLDAEKIAANTTLNHSLQAKVVDALDVASGVAVLEFDFKAVAMPSYPEAAIVYDSHHIVPGMDALVVYGANSNKNGYLFGITNINGEMVLVVRSQNASGSVTTPAQVKLGKQVGEKFHIRLEYQIEEKVLVVYCDDVMLETVQNTLHYNSITGDGSSLIIYQAVKAAYVKDYGNVEMELTNVRAGALDTGSVLDSLTLADSVSGSLPLPAYVADPKLGPVDIIWESSDPSVMSDSGTVKPGANGTVTMTAKVKQEPSVVKVFTVKVSDDTPLFLNASFLEEEADSVPKYCYLGSSAFGAVYDAQKLYLEFDSVMENLSVQLNGNDVEAAVTSQNGVTKAAVSISQLNLYAYDMTAALKLTAGSCSWNGTVRFDSAAMGNRVDKFGSVGSSAGTNTCVAADGAFSFRLNSDTCVDGSPSLRYHMVESVAEVAVASGVSILEFDVCIEEMPSYSAASIEKNWYLVPGLNMTVQCDGSRNARYTFGITNMDGYGLSLVVAQKVDSSVLTPITPLGKTFREQFHIRLEYNTDTNVLTAFCDGAKLGEFGDMHTGIHPTNSSVFMNALVYKKEDAQKGDVAFTVSDFRAGVLKNGSVLDNHLSLEAILGENNSAEAVSLDLSLPGFVEDPMLGKQQITWKSSNTALVGDDGAVVTGAVGEVTMTAALVKDPTVTKAFTLTVSNIKPTLNLDALLNTDGITVDGKLEETVWAKWSRFGKTAGKPAGTVAAAWDLEYLYLALNTVDASAMTLTVGDHELTVDLDAQTVTMSGQALRDAQAVSANGMTELKLPKKALGLQPGDYNDADTALKVVLTGEGGSTELAETNLCFSGKTAQIKTLTDLSGSWTAKNGNHVYNGTQPDAVHYIYKTGNSYNEEETIWISQDLCFTNMPATTGLSIAATSADGYYYYASRNCDGSNGDMFKVCVFADENGVLRANILKETVLNATVELGMSVGDEFRLSTAWNPDGSVDLYVDGCYVGSSNGSCTFYARSCGERVLTVRYTCKATGTPGKVKFQVNNLSVVQMTYTQVVEELTVGNILKNVDMERVTGNLPMVSNYSARFIDNIALTWTTSDESVISNTGIVTRGEEDQACTITLNAMGKELWSVTVNVLSSKVRDFASPAVSIAAYADDVTVDGSIVGENWHMANRILTTANDLVGEMGTAWNLEYLYIAVRNSGMTIGLTVGGKTVGLNAENSVSAGDYTEIAIPMETFYPEGITEYDLELPVTVTVGEGSYTGTLILSSTDWWGAGNTQDPLPLLSGNVKSVGRGNGIPDGNQGAVQVTNGWHLYDRWSATGTNPDGVRTYILFMKTEPYEHFADRDGTTTVEFDFQALSMPEYTVEEAIVTMTPTAYACYGVNWHVSDAADSMNNSNLVYGGIFNTAEGLCLVTDGKNVYTDLIGKKVGDKFRVTICWHADNSVDVYVDGVLIRHAENQAKRENSIGNTSFVLNMLRNLEQPKSAADNMDVYVTDIAFGSAFAQDPLSTVTWDSIKGANDTMSYVTDNLVLPTNLYNHQLEADHPFTWVSSNPDVVTNAGEIIRPENTSAIVTLTVSVEDGTSRSFRLTVPSQNSASGDTLVVEKDRDPATGAGKVVETPLFTFDTNNNSLIHDMGSEQTVNLVKLTDLDTYSRINRESLTLWISGNNASYSQIEDYKLVHVGKCWYLYDFEATGRYVKVHYTHFEGADADFIAPLDGMILGSYDATLVKPETASEVTAPTTTLHDQLTELTGIADTAFLRIEWNGELLYHYVQDGKVFVRIPEPSASGTTLTVWNGRDLELSNKEACYEITYGTRESRQIRVGDGRWLLTVPAGVYDYGTVGQETLLAFFFGGIRASYDGGITWEDYGKVDPDTYAAAAKPVSPSNDVGWLFDEETGAMFCIAFKTNGFSTMEASYGHIVVFASYDMGKNWTYAYEIQPDVVDGLPFNYMITYSGGIRTHAYDGEDGAGIDYVFPVGCQYTNSGAFCTRVAYSTDAGRTWQMSKSLIVDQGSQSGESGLSEAWILDSEDGTLVLYSRCQVVGEVSFAQAYSYDDGLTWTACDTKEAWLEETPAENKVQFKVSSIYSSNTQPLMFRYQQSNGIGAPVFVWGGNNTLGSMSYVRTPLNVAVSYDGLDTWRNIQNLFSETSMDIYSMSGKSMIVNQSVAQVKGDTLLITFDRTSRNDKVMITATDFENYLYKTKGAYDDFESGNPHYEGWSAASGEAANVSGEALGRVGQVMKIGKNGTIARSVPYLQNGTVKLDVYVTDQTDITYALQPAAGDDRNAYTLALIRIAEGKANGLALQEGWNTLEIKLELTEGKANLTAGESSEPLALNLEAGDYVCYVTAFADAPAYMDEFYVVSDLDAVVYTGEIETVTEPEITYNSVSLKGNIGVNYYMTLPEDVLAEEDAYMEFTVEGKTPVEIPVAEAIGETVDGKTYYVFTCQVAAKEMTDTITAQFVYSGGTVEAREFSVRAYADTILEDETGKYDSVKPLVEAMLRYGAYAQLHFGYRTDDLAVDELKDLSGVTAQTLAGFAGSGSESAAYRGNSLLLKSETSLRFFFQVTEGETLSATCNGKPLTVTERSGLQYVAIENIAAKDLDTAYTLDVDGSQITASALTYAYNVLSAQDGTYTDDLENLVKALYLYNQAANTYFKN